jgi:hypothetical protein
VLNGIESRKIITGGVVVGVVVFGVLLSRCGGSGEQNNLTAVGLATSTKPAAIPTKYIPTRIPPATTRSSEKAVVLVRGQESVTVYNRSAPGRCGSDQLERWLTDEQRRSLEIKPGEKVWVTSGSIMKGWGFRCLQGVWMRIR